MPASKRPPIYEFWSEIRRVNGNKRLAAERNGWAYSSLQGWCQRHPDPLPKTPKVSFAEWQAIHNGLMAIRAVNLKREVENLREILEMTKRAVAALAKANLSSHKLED